MNKERIRNALKKQIFGQRGSRIRKSVDIEDIDQQIHSVKHHESFKDSYLMLEKIGEGGHSVVYKCQKLTRQKSSKSLMARQTQYYAVKCFRTDDPEIVSTIIRTFNIQRSLADLSQVCRVYDLFIDQQTKHHYQVIEYCNYQSLDTLIYTHFNRSEIQQIIKQLALSISAIHHRGIAHRDLKPENILVNFNPLEIKLIDFGVSKRFKLRNTFTDMWTRTGTIFYQAPEIFMGGGYDEKIDVWAIGVILYQMLCKKLPFQADTIIDTIDLITSDDCSYFDQLEFQQLNSLERDLLKRLLKKHPDQRLHAQEISLHPWFDNTQHLNQSLDDSIIHNDLVQMERTQSSQMTNQYNNERFQNLMESYEWGQRIHMNKY